MGSDPVFHTRFGNAGINQWTINAINVSIADRTKTGAYISLSCAYDSTPDNTPIPMLAPLGAFTARGGSCDNLVHLVAVSPALAGLTDSTMSGWSCSIHNGFDIFPSAFIPLAIGEGLTGGGIRTFADGSVGVPYILSRGLAPILCGDGVIQSTEQCDDGSRNGVLGDPCSLDCRLHWCGDGIVDAGEACDKGALNGAPGSPCSSSCTILGPVCNPGCVNGNCTFMSDGIHTHCLCASGWSGPDCACNIPSYWLSTDHPAVLDVSRSGFPKLNTMQLWVNVSSKYYNDQITFRNEKNASCNFPATAGSNYWTSTYYGSPQCQWADMALIPWGNAWTDCLFQRVESTNYITFSGEMDATLLEDLAPIRGFPLTRTLIETLPFQVVFPKSVSVTSDALNVYSAYLIQAAIITQTYVSTSPPNGLGTVRLYTTVQWPYVIQGPLLASSDHAALPITVSGPEVPPGSAPCPNDGSSICQQVFDFAITPAAGQCDLNANYLFNFTVGCQPAIPANSCPLLGSIPGAISYSLQSSYFCQQVIANIQLSATIEPYPSPAYTTPKYDFMVGETAYYLVSASSTQVSITTTTVSQITAVAPDSTHILLYDSSAGGNTVAGNTVSLVVTNGFPGHGTPSTDDTFSLVYDPTFFHVPSDTMTHWTFVVTVNVVFFNTGPASSKPTTQSHTLTIGEFAQESFMRFVLNADDGTDSSHAGRDLSAQAQIILSAADTMTSDASMTRPTAEIATLAAVALASFALL